MSSRDLYRNPTWAGLIPESPRFEAAQLDVARMIMAVLGANGAVSVLSNAGGASEFYRFDGECGQSKFIKILPSARRASLVRAEEVARWLAARRINVICADEAPRQVDEERWMFIYPYVEAERVGPNYEDMSRLGRAIADLHGALSAHPDRALWVQETQARLRNLQEIREALGRSALEAGPDPEALAQIARRTDLTLSDEGESARPLHGDLNPCNVLKRRSDGKLVFLDFEDTFHSVLQVEFELALVVERSVLLWVDDDDLALSLVHTLIDAYVSGNGRFTPEALRRIPDTLQRLALRSMCVLADSERLGLPIVESEWRKFFALFKLADARRNVFR